MTDPNYIKQVSLAGSPAQENSASWGQLAVSLVIGGASAVVWLAIVQDRRPAALVAAFAFGGYPGTRSLADRRCPGRPATPGPGVDRVEGTRAVPGLACGGCRPVPKRWGSLLKCRERLGRRPGAAPLDPLRRGCRAAVCGAVATFLFLTPERVLQHDILTLGLASLLGLVISLVGAVATWKRTEAWEALFAQWVRQAGEWKVRVATAAFEGAEIQAS